MIETDQVLVACGTKAAAPPPPMTGSDPDQRRHHRTEGASLQSGRGGWRRDRRRVRLDLRHRRCAGDAGRSTGTPAGLRRSGDRRRADAPDAELRRDLPARRGRRPGGALRGGQSKRGRPRARERQAHRVRSGPLHRTHPGDRTALLKAGWRSTSEEEFVDDSFWTNVDNIYAAGDVIGFLPSRPPQRAGRIAACRMLVSRPRTRSSYPYASTIPEISMCGTPRSR